MAEIIDCCAYFVECSDAKECIRKYSKYESLRIDNGDHCTYNNKGLKKGIILYGENANIELPPQVLIKRRIKK